MRLMCLVVGGSRRRGHTHHEGLSATGLVVILTGEQQGYS